MLRRALLFLLALSACDSSEPPKVDAPDAKVLARVDGGVITEADLAAAATESVGARYAAAMDASGRRKLLDSLILSRAIARRASDSLSAKERGDLDRRVRLYRERLLVEHYLAAHNEPEKVTAEMVKRYYEANPTRFGGGVMRRYEILVGTRKLDGNERDTTLATLRQASAQEGWREWAEGLAARGMPLAYRQSTGNTAGLPRRLTTVLEGLGVGETSSVLFIDGRPHVARLAEERRVPPRPLAEVARDIQEILKAKRRSDMLAEASAEVLSDADVEYRDEVRRTPR